MIQFTEKQTKAIRGDIKHLQSCAGTGKTEIIIQRVCHLVEQGVPINKIALITFTNKAANEMRDRVTKTLAQRYKERKDPFIRLQVEQLGFARIGTIHNIAQDLLEKHGLSIGLSPVFKVSSFKQEAREIIYQELQAYAQSSGKTTLPSYKVVELILELYLKNAARGVKITDKAFLTAGKDEELAQLKNDIKAVYLRSVKVIETSKIQRGILNPDDLPRFAAMLFQDADIANAISNKIHYLFVDEYHDTDPAQHEFISALSNSGTKVFVAGDVTQSIYSFRGADPSIFKNLTGNNALVLNENFRSDGNLITRINEIFTTTFTYNGNIIKLGYTELSSKQKGKVKNPMRLLHAAEITDVVRNVRLGCETYRDIAILCRNNIEVAECVASLKKAHVPVVSIGGRSFYKSQIVVDTCKALNALIYESKSHNLELRYTMLRRSFCVGNDPKLFWEILASLRADMKKQNPSGFLLTLYEVMGILPYIDDNIQEKANLYKLVDKARNHKTLIEFSDYLDVMVSTGKEEDEAEIPHDKIGDAIIVSTIHKAKGLGFKNVIIPYIDKHIIKKKKPAIVFEPGSAFGIDTAAAYGERSNKEADENFEKFLHSKRYGQLEEELRILFVAITRARESVWFLTSRDQGKIEYVMRMNPQFVSYYSWLKQVQNGKFIDQIAR